MLLKISETQKLPQKRQKCVLSCDLLLSSDLPEEKILSSDWSKFSHRSVWEKYTENLQLFKNAYCSATEWARHYFFGRKLKTCTFTWTSPKILIWMGTVQKWAPKSKWHLKNRSAGNFFFLKKFSHKFLEMICIKAQLVCIHKGPNILDQFKIKWSDNYKCPNLRSKVKKYPITAQSNCTLSSLLELFQWHVQISEIFRWKCLTSAFQEI